MRYLFLLIMALLLGPALNAVAKGFDGANAPGGQEVGGVRYNPIQGTGGQNCCTADADVQAIDLGLKSEDETIQNAADEALLKQLRGQIER